MLYLGTKPKVWPDMLCWVEFWFNTTNNVSSAMTPFKHCMDTLDPG